MQIQASYGISNRIDELINNLEELESAVHNGDSQVDLCEVRFVTPLAILPLVTFAYHNDIAITCSEKDDSVSNYLATIGFPNGLTELAKN